MEKYEIRNLIRSRLGHSFDGKTASERITEYAIAETAFSDARSIFIFLSTPSEPDTGGIIAAAIEAGKKVFVPVVRGDEMFAAEYTSDSDTVQGAFGIKEPSNVKIANAVPELTFVPLVAFDADKNRLGHGKGYYDKYLAGKSTRKIALAFAKQSVDRIPVSVHDVAMDEIVTEEGVIR